MHDSFTCSIALISMWCTLVVNRWPPCPDLLRKPSRISWVSQEAVLGLCLVSHWIKKQTLP